ncbi:hypothetical protein NSB25_25830 [Acetatifactor muris]|nr:hypothetical protein [Acetatifactor muris]MCR2050657.1 hypothetical protein [Acetatifactor muris]
MKHNELKVKTMFYKTLADFLFNKEEILDLCRRLYNSLKDVPTEELQTEFINKLAEIIHEQNKTE